MARRNGRDPPFRFNIQRDLHLLETTVSFNPFQLGRYKWEEVATALQNQQNYAVKGRTCRDWVNHLLKKLEKQELTDRSGTEEERSERGRLLEEIRTLIEMEEVPINPILGADEEDIDKDDGDKENQPKSSKKSLDKEEAEQRNLMFHAIQQTLKMVTDVMHKN